ncbi:MAG: sulfatase-like hydrolase/transferase [Kiritimatiellae bacterium]|nr:sulfatase-like hydrolase/transferase [Kiritimatiellia bacterium]
MRQPNLLFLYTDEQRADTLAAYGNTRIAMPNLNRLAAQATVFERTYVTQPVCTPSRSTLLTGLMPHTNGCVANNVPLPADVPCLPELLPADYVCAHHGKWHLGDEIYAQHGFGEWRAIEDMYIGYYSNSRDRNDRSHYHHWLVEHGYEPKSPNGVFNRNYCAALPEAYSKPRYLAQEASRFIRENKDRPFALYVNFLEPHMPFTSCRDGQYDPNAITLPANFEHADYPTLRARVTADKLRRPYGSEADWRALIARYWGMCSLVDTHVGQILATLSECGLDENTIVVFTSDHGDMMGSHKLLAKALMYEEAVRVPFLIRVPGVSGGRQVAEPVSQLDIVPTLLDLMGVDIPDTLEGESLRPAIEGTDRCKRDVVIEWYGHEGRPQEIGELLAGRPEWNYTIEQVRASFGDPIRTLITADGWKFCCSPMGEHMLYDLNADPHEMNNLAADPAQADRMNRMLDRIRQWQARTGDQAELPARIDVAGSA